MFRYHFMNAVFQVVLLCLLASKKLVGRENLPASGPYLFLVNHPSHLDFLFLLTTLPAMRGRFLASEKWLRYWVIGPVLRFLGAISITRGAANSAGLKEALKSLHGGEILGLNPEGTSSRSGMLKGKNGAAYLANRADVAILPVALVNTDQVIKNAKRLRPTKVEVRIGQPFKLPAQNHYSDWKTKSAHTHLIMIHIAALLPPECRGYYTDSPALAAFLAGRDPWPIIQEAAFKNSDTATNQPRIP